MLLRGKKIIKSLFLVTASGCLLFSNFFGSSVIKSLPNESKKAKLQSQKRELAEELKKASEEVSKEAKNKESIDKKISIVKNQIDISNDTMHKLDKKILSLREQIEEIKKNMDKKIDHLKAVLVSMEEAGNTYTIDIILGAKNFEDFIDKVEIVRSIIKHVRKIIDELKSDLNAVEGKEKELTETKTAQEKVRKGLEENRKGLQELLDESERLLGELQGEEQKVKDRIDQNDAQIKAFDAEMERYYAEQKRREEAAKAAAAKAGRTYVSENPAPSGKFMWPVPGYHIAGSGIYGAPVVASASGTVQYAGPCGGYGNRVVINHGGGISTLYGHMSSIAVSAGQAISQGQVIGNVGSTGFSTGPHLHFEYRVDGVRRNPREIV